MEASQLEGKQGLQTCEVPHSVPLGHSKALNRLLPLSSCLSGLLGETLHLLSQEPDETLFRRHWVERGFWTWHWLGGGSLPPGMTLYALHPNTSHGVELVNASALFLLLLLNLLLIGRQDRLKRHEVERRLRGIIDQIQGEARARYVGGDSLRLPASAQHLGWPMVSIPEAVFIASVRRMLYSLLSRALRSVGSLWHPGCGLGRQEANGSTTGVGVCKCWKVDGEDPVP